MIAHLSRIWHELRINKARRKLEKRMTVRSTYPKVRVVVVTDGEVSEKALGAIYRQNYPNFDVVIYQNRHPVDVSSLPKRERLVMEHAHACSANRMTAKRMALAEGVDFVMFVDMDVVLPPSAIWNLIREFARNDHSLTVPPKTYSTMRGPVTETKLPRVFAGWYRNKGIDGYLGARVASEDTLHYFQRVEPGLTPSVIAPMGCIMFPAALARKLPIWNAGKLAVPFNTTTGKKVGFSDECLQVAAWLAEKDYEIALVGDVVCEHLTLSERAPKVPLFILCYMRSGSTLLKALLANAPDVAYVNEINHWVWPLDKVGFTDKLEKVAPEQIVPLKLPFTPNITALSKYQLPDVPGAKVIVLVRSAKEIIESIRKHNMMDHTKHSDEYLDWSIEQAYRHIANIAEGRDVKVVTYDELIADPKRVTKDLFAWMGSTETEGFDTYEVPPTGHWDFVGDIKNSKMTSRKVVRNATVDSGLLGERRTEDQGGDSVSGESGRSEAYPQRRGDG